jgi:hypothetical protein
MPSTSAPRRLLVLLVAFALVAGSAVGFVARGFAETPPQPHMREALEALRNARHHLQLAAPDHGGHRNRAIQLTDQAIAETQAGIDYANHH